MNPLLRVLAAFIGVFLIAAVLRSVCQVAVNRRSGDWLAHRIGWLVHTTLARRALNRQSYTGIQDVMAWALPFYILLLIVSWFSFVVAGFSLLIWSSQSEPSLLQAVISSGSALSTLGFRTPQNTAGQLLAIGEGAMGLGIVVFYFTFIPGFQTTIQSRQDKVAWLYRRGGSGLTNFALLEWFLLCGANDWNGLWEDWESWFRDLGETHALTPILAFVPTIHPGQTWLVAAAVALDSVSLYRSVLEERAIPSANVCFRTGVDALRLIASKLPSPRGASKLVSGRCLARHTFDAACEQLTASGAEVNPDRDACWIRFAELRGEYEASLLSLAGSLLVPVQDSLLLPLASAEAQVETAT